MREVLMPGQRIELEGARLVLGFKCSCFVACFAADAQGKPVGEAHSWPSGHARSQLRSAQAESGAGGRHAFALDFAAAEAEGAQKFCFVLASAGNPGTLGPAQLRSNSFVYALDEAAFGDLKEMIVCEVYKRGSGWRLAAFAQGAQGEPARAARALACACPGAAAQALQGSGAAQKERREQGPSEPAPLPFSKKYWQKEDRDEGQASRVQPAVDRGLSNPEPQAGEKALSLDKVSLGMGQSASVNLARDISSKREIEVKVTWEGAADLDLRAGLLLPDGRMALVVAENAKSLAEKPYVLHSGDARGRAGETSSESMRINPLIGSFLKGRVALVFAVHSAAANGPVSVADLKPRMEVRSSEGYFECSFAPSGKAGGLVYTYAIGMVAICAGKMQIKQLGQASAPMSEATPWLEWDGREAFPAMSWAGPAHVKGEAVSRRERVLEGEEANLLKAPGPARRRLRYVEFSEI